MSKFEGQSTRAIVTVLNRNLPNFIKDGDQPITFQRRMQIRFWCHRRLKPYFFIKVKNIAKATYLQHSPIIYCQYNFFFFSVFSFYYSITSDQSNSVTRMSSSVSYAFVSRKHITEIPRNCFVWSWISFLSFEALALVIWSFKSNYRI